MRTSRQLARRLAMYEAILQDTRTEVDRRRILQAIAQVRGRLRQHLDVAATATKVAQGLEDYFSRSRGAA